MFAIGQSNFLQALGGAVLNSLWQMALLWVIYQIATAIFRTISSSQKSSLATSLLFAGFAWFVFTFITILTASFSVHTGYSVFFSINGNEAVNAWFYKMLPIASVIYLVLFTLPVLNFIRNYRYVQVIRHNGIGKADVKWRMFVQKVAAQMGIKKAVHIWMSDLVNSPVTIGYIKPIILLPVAAVNHLSTQQVEAILLHELSHIKRFDYLINLITRIIQTILYFNPFVKAFAKVIEREREKDCDAMVLQFQYEPYGYASALLTLEKAAHLPQSLAVAASGGKKNELLHRIESILGIRKETTFSFNKLAGIIAGLLCFISLNALLLLSKPGETKLSSDLLTDLSGPFHFVTPEEVSGTPAEVKAASIVNHAETVSVVPEIVKEESVAMATAKAAKPQEPTPLLPNNSLPFVNVNYTENIIPVLGDEQEEQVKEALAASKKVMAEDRWKIVEQNIADAMTSQQKEKVKAAYQKSLNKLDWERMQDQLRLSYDNINWNQINTQLNNALVEIKLDSLQQVYTTVMSDLSTIEKELEKANQPGIPDSDISLKSIEQQKKQVLKVITTIKSARTRKIVHL